MTDYHNDFGAIPVRREAYTSLIDANEMAKNDYYYYKAGREHADEEAYKMSAELEWHKKFHNYVRDHDMNEMDYKLVCKFLSSEDDR
jgi:hypothetical protein